MDRSSFLEQMSTLKDTIQSWWNSSITIQPLIQYICSEGYDGCLIMNFYHSLHHIFRQRFVRIPYLVKSRENSDNNRELVIKSTKDCMAVEIHSIYLTEPNVSNELIYQALKTAWQETSGGRDASISSDFFIDTSYVTDDK